MTSFDDDDDEVVVVGRRLPRLVSISAMDEFNVAVTWEADTRTKAREIVDLSLLVSRYSVYAPLRDDPALFRTVRLQDHRYGVTWGDGTIDMGTSSIADVADEAMTPEDFSAFMDRHSFTLDRVAAELGISRRMAAYYKKEHKVPRTVGLACLYIDLKASDAQKSVDDVVRLKAGIDPYSSKNDSTEFSRYWEEYKEQNDFRTGLVGKLLASSIAGRMSSVPLLGEHLYPPSLGSPGWKAGIGKPPMPAQPERTRKR